jgi:hypothetical protein
MDRTDEFRSLFAQGGQIGKPIGVNGLADDSSQSSDRSGFNAEAAKIGQEIHLAQLKLDELGKRT